MDSKLSKVKVFLLGSSLIGAGMGGFYYIPGMIDDDQATGSRLVNAFYCSTMTLTTVGFGDICPGNTDQKGKVFLILYTLCGIGMFCGPIMEMASSWKNRLHGGYLYMLTVTLGIGALIYSQIEGLSTVDAIYASMITGKIFVLGGCIWLRRLSRTPSTHNTLQEPPWDTVTRHQRQIWLVTTGSGDFRTVLYRHDHSRKTPDQARED